MTFSLIGKCVTNVSTIGTSAANAHKPPFASGTLSQQMIFLILFQIKPI